MAALHIVSKATSLASCLSAAADDDCVLLIEDAVYALTSSTPRDLQALEDDVSARGLTTLLAGDVALISYEHFVDLVVTHTPVVSWN